MVTRADRKARTRAAILKAAKDLFVRDGFDGASIRDVAEAAGVGVGSVHAHFGDKDRLLLACFLEQIEDAVSLGLETLDAEAPLLDQLCHLVRVLYVAYARHPALSRVMLRVTLFPNPEEAVGDEAIRAEFLGEVTTLFRAARERGEITRLDADGALAAQAFFSFYAAALFGGVGGMFGHDDRAEGWVTAFRSLMGQHLVGLGATP